MSKIQELKTKLTERLGAIRGAIFKNSAAKEQQPSLFQKISHTWKSGTTGTRLLLFVMFLTLTVSIYSCFRLGIQLAKRRNVIQGLFSGGTDKYEKMGDFLKREAENKHDTSSTVSLDRIRLNAELKDGKSAFLSINIYVKCDSPKTAKFVEDNYPLMHDAILSKMQIIRETDITTEPGKVMVKEKMIEAMNASLHSGKVIDVFFYNMIYE